MGTGSSICSTDPDIPEYSPSYLGQIYAGVVFHSAASSSGGYASTLSLNSIHASSVSLNSPSRRRSSQSTEGPGVLRVRREEETSAKLPANSGMSFVGGNTIQEEDDILMIDESEDDIIDGILLPPLAQPESITSIDNSRCKMEDQEAGTVRDKNCPGCEDGIDKGNLTSLTVPFCSDIKTAE